MSNKINLLYEDKLAKDERLLTFKFIDYNDKELIAKYIKVRKSYNVALGNLHYTANFMYNALNNNHNNMVSECNIENDSILLLVRKVSIGKAQYYRTSEYPISLNSHPENEDYAFKLLFENKHVQQAYIPEQFLGRIDKAEYTVSDKPSDYNFFSNIEEDLLRMNNKYMTKYRVKMVIGNTDFVFRPLELSDITDVFTLYEKWKDNKDDLHNKILFKNFFSQYSYLVGINKDLLHYCMSYKDKIIALVIFAKTTDEYCYKLLQWNYSRKDFSDDRVLDKVLSQIGQILHYFYTAELGKLGIKFMSCAGSSDGNKGLLSHKMETMRNKIDYYKVVLR